MKLVGTWTTKTCVEKCVYISRLFKSNIHTSKTAERVKVGNLVVFILSAASSFLFGFLQMPIAFCASLRKNNLIHMLLAIVHMASNYWNAWKWLNSVSSDDDSSTLLFSIISTISHPHYSTLYKLSWFWLF